MAENIYIVTYIYHGCVVVWLITLHGFGLDIGFIHYGDYNWTWLQLQWTLCTRSSLDPTDGTVLHRRLTSRAEHFCFRRLTDDDSLRGPTPQLPRNPAYNCWLRIHRDLLSRLLGMAQLYPGYDCEQLLPSSNTSLYIHTYSCEYAVNTGTGYGMNYGRIGVWFR
jgi:hypothetical protein